MSPTTQVQTPEITADEDGVRISWPLDDGHRIGDVAKLIAGLAARYPDYRLDWCDFDRQRLLLDFINPDSII